MEADEGKDKVAVAFGEAGRAKATTGFLAWEAGARAKRFRKDLEAVGKALKKKRDGKPSDYGEAADRLDELGRDIGRLVPALRKAAQG